MPHLSASYAITARIKMGIGPDVFSKISRAIAEVGADVEAIDLVEVGGNYSIRDFTIACSSQEHSQQVIEALRALEGIELIHVSDDTFLLHLGGKIRVQPKIPIRTRNDLSMAYTPGVARVSEAIAEDPKKVWNLTVKRNTVAIVTDGSAVLGLGNLGPEAALPVMEGKAMLFKEFAGIDAWPIVLRDVKDPERLVEVVVVLSPGFGGINLEDIAAPRCFYVEERLSEVLDIPVFHDDQHGTAIVVLAAAINAAKVVGKDLREMKVVVQGIGAAGIACTKLLMAYGVQHFIGVDKEGIITRDELYPGQAGKQWYAEHTNPERIRGKLRDALKDADMFLGVSAPNTVTVEDLKVMAKDPIVFALANPVPEIAPEEAAKVAAVVATGRSDYPNQINNVLAFPGVFRGALDVQAEEINLEMKIAAAEALAQVIRPQELSPDYIVPSVFNREVVKKVSRAVAEAAALSGVARRKLREAPLEEEEVGRYSPGQGFGG